MNAGSWIELAILVACLLLAAFASAGETALTAIGRIALRTLQERDTPAARAVTYVRRDPSLFLSTILIINSVALIVASSMGTLLLVHNLPAPWGELAATAGISFLVLVFAELTPKNLAVRRPESVALFLGRAVLAASIVLKPVILVLGWVVSGIMRVLGQGGYNKPTPLITEEELREIVSVSEAEGVLEEEEHDMIRGIFEFGETTVGEVKVPRVDMVALPVTTPLLEALDVILQQGHSRIPIYGENIDDIIGILYDKDVLKYVRENTLAVSLREVVRPALFVPESKRVDELFRELQRRKVHIAIVLDEYGGVDGLVTLEDLLEEIVGEIQDETDREEPLFEQLDENTFDVSAMIDMEQLNEMLNVALPENGVETLGGFVYEQVGEVPAVGAVISVSGLSIEVLELEGRRIRTLRIRRPEPAQPSQSDGGDTRPAG
ncbi:MAG TPA: hemolysin family protein [Chloroflexota bacterium]|nr:hemolysin family protein [Chloroflexota bacterium]